jgi:hypothetical protein
MMNSRLPLVFQLSFRQAIVAIGLLFCCAWPSMVEADTDSICIQTFNAYGPAYSRDPEKRTVAVGQDLSASPCGIVQMQEVWSDTHHNWMMDALAESMFSLSSIRFDDVQRPQVGQSGLATFTTEILSSQSFVPFQVNSDGLMDNVRELLGVIKGIGSSMVTIRQDEDQKIQLMNVHLHPTSQRVRIAQIVQILEAFYKKQPLESPLLITGDFNFQPSSVEYNLLQSVTRMTDAYVANNGPYASNICTYCESNIHHWPGPNGVLDYIWSRRSQHRTVIHSQTFMNLHGLNGVTPSDHFGLRSHIQMPESSLEFIDATTFDVRRQSALNAIYAAIRTLDGQGAESEPFQSTRRYLIKLAERLDQSMNSADLVIFNLKIK